MFRMAVTIACILCLAGVGLAGSMDGSWQGRGTVSMTVVKVWLKVKDVNGTPEVVLDFLIGPGMARVDDDGTEPRYEGAKLFWTISAPSSGEYACWATRLDDQKAEAVCRQGEQELKLDLSRFEGNQWVSGALETVATGEEEARYVQAVADVARAMAASDFDKFDSYFVDNPKGTLPQELYRRAFFVTMKFGRIQKIVFSEFDDPGAFVTVHFAENKRDFYVHLAEEGKLIELTYVPQPDPHFK